MNKNQQNFDEIQDQHLDAMLKLAFKQADALETQRILEKCEQTGCEVDEKSAAAAYDRFLDKLAGQEKQERKQARTVKFRRGASRFIQAAACIVVILAIAAPVALANVEAIRVKVMQLLIDIQEDHTELSFVEDNDKEFSVPADWSGLYYPSYIPDGYTMAERGILCCDVAYINADGEKFYFNEYQQDDYVNINSENADLSYVDINGKNAFVVERADVVIMTWAVEDRFFVIEGEIEREEALMVAKSVQRISVNN